MAIQIASATIYAHSPDEESLRPTVQSAIRHRSISPDESGKSGLRVHRTRKFLSRRPVPGLDGPDGVYKCLLQNALADSTEHEAEHPSVEVLAVAYDDHVNVGRAGGWPPP
jgi:hypothetical protein